MDRYLEYSILAFKKSLEDKVCFDYYNLIYWTRDFHRNEGYSAWLVAIELGKTQSILEVKQINRNVD